MTKESAKCIHGSGGMARHGVIETNCRVASGGIVHSGGTRTQQGHLPGRPQRQHPDCCVDVVQGWHRFLNRVKSKRGGPRGYRQKVTHLSNKVLNKGITLIRSRTFLNQGSTTPAFTSLLGVNNPHYFSLDCQ